MMIWTAKFSKIRVLAALALAAGIALAAVLALSAIRGETGRDSNQTPEEINLRENDGRIAYLARLGWEVDPEPVESFRFLLPEPLKEPYLSYNALQLPQGFDLNQHTGEQITRYTYKIKNYPNRPDGVQANLYISENQAVAGDIFCPGANGFQQALIRDEGEQSKN